MKTGFAHFDDSHRENFCAAALLLAMEVEDDVKQFVAGVVKSALRVENGELVAMGREARLADMPEQEGYARVDLWLLFRAEGAHFHVFVEVKTHDRWDAKAVAKQVRDQASRPRLVRSAHPIRGSVLLAPTRLCDRVRAVAEDVPIVAWSTLLSGLRQCAPTSRLARHTVRHLEENVDRPIGIAGRTLAAFDEATTTIACLREFLTACIADIGGTVAKGLNMTTGDGEPLRWSGWAWHGLSVPFQLNGTKYRLGIYKYVESPEGEDAGVRETPWLEAYKESGQDPLAFLPFNPSTLAPSELEIVRSKFKEEWARREQKASGGAA